LHRSTSAYAALQGLFSSSGYLGGVNEGLANDCLHAGTDTGNNEPDMGTDMSDEREMTREECVAELAKLRKRYSMLEAVAVERKRDIKDLTQQLGDLRNTPAKREIENLKKKAAEAGRLAFQRTEQLMKLEGEMKAAKQQSEGLVAQLELKVADQSAVLESWAEQRKADQGEMKTLKEQLAQAYVGLHEAETEACKVKDALSAHHEQLKACEDDRKGLAEDLIEMRNMKDAGEQQREADQCVINDLLKLQAEHKATVSELKDRLADGAVSYRNLEHGYNIQADLLENTQKKLEGSESESEARRKSYLNKSKLVISLYDKLDIQREHTKDAKHKVKLLKFSTGVLMVAVIALVVI